MSCELHSDSGPSPTASAPASILAVHRSPSFTSARGSEFLRCCCCL